jgi:hypothetical protein
MCAYGYRLEKGMQLRVCLLEVCEITMERRVGDARSEPVPIIILHPLCVLDLFILLPVVRLQAPWCSFVSLLRQQAHSTWVGSEWPYTTICIAGNLEVNG